MGWPATRSVPAQTGGGHDDYRVSADIRIQKRAWLPNTVADGVEEIRRVVRELLMRGADFIKICATGGITSITDSWDELQFTIEEIRTAVEGAAAKKSRVVVHAEGIDGICNAVQAGIHTLEHGWFLDEQSVDKTIQVDTWWVTTLAKTEHLRSIQRFGIASYDTTSPPSQGIQGWKEKLLFAHRER